MPRSGFEIQYGPLNNAGAHVIRTGGHFDSQPPDACNLEPETRVQMRLFSEGLLMRSHLGPRARRGADTAARNAGDTVVLDQQGALERCLARAIENAAIHK